MASNDEEWTVVTKSKPKPRNERSSGNYPTNEIEQRKLSPHPNTKPARYNTRDLSRKADKIGGSNPRNFPPSKHQQDYPESGGDRNQLRFNSMKGSSRENDYMKDRFRENDYMKDRFREKDYMKDRFREKDYMKDRFRENDYMKDSFRENDYMKDSFREKDMKDSFREKDMKKSFRENDTYYRKRLVERSTNNNRFQTPDKEKVITKRPGVIILPKGKTTKKKSKNKNKTDPQYLKSVNQVSLDLRDVLKEAPIARDKESKKVRTSTGAGIRTQVRTSTKERIAPRNVLDSSAPAKHRGKERVTPKNKKPTKLKRLVLEERRLYRLQRALRRTNCEEKSTIVDGEDSLNNDVLLPVIKLTFVDPDLNETELEAEFYSPKEETENEASGDVKEFDGAVINLEKEGALLVRAEETDNLNSIEQAKQSEVLSKPEAVRSDLETFQVSFIGEGLPGLHTKKFREYCNQMPDKTVDEQTTKLLYELMRLQARQHDMNKIKSKGRKRLVFGFHEVTKHLKVQNIKCIVIARDLERSRAIGGLEHQIVSICGLCRAQKVQVIFALTKSTLSFSVCKARTIVSIVGILNYDGRQQIYKDLVQLVTVKEQEYSETVRVKREQLLKAGKENEEVLFERLTEDEVQSEGADSEISSSSTIPQDTSSIASSGSRKKNKKKKKSTNSENSQSSVHIKKFEAKDVDTSEFIPNNFPDDPRYYHPYPQYSDSRLEYFDYSYQMYSSATYIYYPYSLDPYTQQQYNY